MKTLLKLSLFTILIFSLSFADSRAQSYVGTQRMISFSMEDLMILAGDKFDEDAGPDDMAKYLFAMSVKDILQKAGAQELEPEIEETTIYISGQKMRMDTGTEERKMSVLMRMDERKIYQITWAKKQYMVTSWDEIAEMQKQAQDAIKNMEGMEAILDKLPPEARAQMEASMGLSKSKSEPPKVTKTGKTATMNGFVCQEYIVTAGSSQSQYWVTKKYSDLRKVFEAMINEMPDFESSGDDVDEKEVWKQIPDAWPIVIKGLKFDMMSFSGSFDIEEMLTMEEKGVPAGTFDVPENFAKIGMQEMMQGEIRR